MGPPLSGDDDDNDDGGGGMGLGCPRTAIVQFT